MNARVLLAEDNDDLANLVRRGLEARDITVTRARSASEAEPRLRGDRFDAVILDYRLPDGNGLDLLRVVRESAPATPVLFLTAHGSEDVALQALALGASDYMQKSGRLLEELPGRVVDLLARGADQRRAATVVAVPARPARTERAASELLDADEARVVLAAFVKGDILGAALFDGAGEPIAALLPANIDPRPLGLALVQVHAQAVLMGRTTHLVTRGYTFTLDTTEGTIAATGLAGRALAAVLVKPGTPRATESLHALAGRLL